MSTGLKLLLYVSGIVLALIILLALILNLPIVSRPLENAIVSRINDSLGVEAHLEDIQVVIFPPSINIKGLKIKEVSLMGCLISLSAHSVSLRPKLFQALLGEMYFRRVLIKEPSIEVKLLPYGESESRFRYERPSIIPSLPLVLKHLVITRGNIRFSLPRESTVFNTDAFEMEYTYPTLGDSHAIAFSGKEFIFQVADITGSFPSIAGSIKVDTDKITLEKVTLDTEYGVLTGTGDIMMGGGMNLLLKGGTDLERIEQILASRNIQLKPLKGKTNLEMHLDGKIDDPKVRGYVSIPEGTAILPFKGFSSQVFYDKGELRLEQYRFRIGGGVVSGKGTLNLDEGPHLRTQLRLSDIQPAKAVHLPVFIPAVGIQWNKTAFGGEVEVEYYPKDHKPVLRAKGYLDQTGNINYRVPYNDTISAIPPLRLRFDIDYSDDITVINLCEVTGEGLHFNLHGSTSPDFSLEVSGDIDAAILPAYKGISPSGKMGFTGRVFGDLSEGPGVILDTHLNSTAINAKANLRLDTVRKWIEGTVKIMEGNVEKILTFLDLTGDFRKMPSLHGSFNGSLEFSSSLKGPGPATYGSIEINLERVGIKDRPSLKGILKASLEKNRLRITTLSLSEDDRMKGLETTGSKQKRPVSGEPLNPSKDLLRKDALADLKGTVEVNWRDLGRSHLSLFVLIPSFPIKNTSYILQDERLKTSEGDVSFNARVSGEFIDPYVEGDIDFSRIYYDRLRLTRGHLRIELDKKRLNLRGNLLEKGVIINGSISPAKGHPFSLNLKLDSFPMRVLSDYTEGRMENLYIFPFEGELKGEMAIEGDLKDISSVSGHVELSRLELKAPEHHLSSEKAVSCDISRGNLSCKPFVIKWNEGSLTMVLNSEGLTEVDAKSTGMVDLSILRVFFDEISHAEGDVDLNLKLSGHILDPLILGRAETENGCLGFYYFPQDFENIQGSVELLPSGFHTKGLRSRLGGGDFIIDGSIGLKEGRIEKYMLFARGRDIDFHYPPWLPSEIEGNIRLTGLVDYPILSGDIQVKRAVFSKRMDWKAKVLEVERKTDTISTHTSEEGIRFDLNLHADNNLWVRNNLMEIEFGADMRVVGTRDHIVVLGEARGLEGEIFFKERTFRLLSGMIDFNDPLRFNPRVDFFGTTEVTNVVPAPGEEPINYQVFVRASGKLRGHGEESLKVELGSDPPMNEDDIACLLYFSQPCMELIYGGGGGEAEAISLVIDKLIGRQLRKYFGLDKVEFDPIRSNFSDTPVPFLVLGKEITPSLYMKFLSDIGSVSGERRLEVDYELLDNLPLEGFVRNESDGAISMGGEVKLRFEFW